MTVPDSKPSTSPAWTRYLPPLVAFVVMAVLGILVLRPASPQNAANPLVGQVAPDINQKALDGQQVHLAALKGQPVILNFWASWCGPCKDEAPLFHELAARQTSEKFKIVGLLFQETSEANARQFIAEHGLNYPNVLSKGVDTGIAYSISGIPVTVFIDKNGVIQHIDRGGLTLERLNVGLEKVGLSKV